MPSGVFDRLVDLLVNRRRLLLAVAVVLTVLSIYPSRQLGFDESIESLYSASNIHLKDYVESKKLFGGDEFVFVVFRDKNLLNDQDQELSKDAQERIQKLSDRLSEVKGVVPDSTQSIARTLGFTRLPFFKNKYNDLIEFSRGILLGDDHETTAVVVRLDEANHAKETRAETLSAIRRVAEEQPMQTFVVGEPVLVHDMFRYAEEDGEWMGWAASILLTLVILYFLRQIRAVILPFVIVQCAIVWTKAMVWVTGMQLSMVSSILNSLVTIIGVSTVVYMSLYYRKLREEYNRVDGFRQTLRMIGVDVFWVCLTTAAGFGAQMSSHLHPIQSFGLTMVIGSLLVLVAMILILPSGFLMGPEREVPLAPRGDKQVNQSLQGLAHWVLNHPLKVYLGCAVLLIVSGMGLYRLKIETDFSKNFRSDSPVVQGLNYLETRLGGAGIWEVNFPAPASLNEEFLEKVRRLAAKLREIGRDGKGPSLTKALAITDGLDMIPHIPFITHDAEAKAVQMNRIQPEFIPSLYNPKEGRMRIMLRAYERQSAEGKQQLIDTVRTLSQEEFPEAKATGLFVLLTFLIESLLDDQTTDLILGAISLITIMTIAYRSLWMGIISLVPNVIPIIMLLGGMGWFNIHINIGTAMISSDTMGLTIHDSIFYLSAYLRMRRSGHDFGTAINHVQTETRQPLLYSNIALILGFLVLATSHFVPLIYFGVMVSVAIAGGLAVNLLLLPLLLQLGESFSKKKS